MYDSRKPSCCGVLQFAGRFQAESETEVRPNQRRSTKANLGTGICSSRQIAARVFLPNIVLGLQKDVLSQSVNRIL